MMSNTFISSRMENNTNTKEFQIVEKLTKFYDLCESKTTFVSLFDEVLDKIGLLMECKNVTLFVLHDDVQKY